MMKTRKKTRKFDLDKWEDWKEFNIGAIERNIANNKIDTVEIKVTRKDGMVESMAWFSPFDEFLLKVINEGILDKLKLKDEI